MKICLSAERREEVARQPVGRQAEAARAASSLESSHCWHSVELSCEQAAGIDPSGMFAGGSAALGGCRRESTGQDGGGERRAERRMSLQLRRYAESPCTSILASRVQGMNGGPHALMGGRTLAL